mgnify:FL=1
MVAAAFDRPAATKPKRSRKLPSPRRVGGTLTLEAFDQKYLPMIETALEKQVSGDNRDTILKSLEGGKRLRALLAMLTYKGCNGDDDAKGVKTAVAAELSHVASLVKDDILDKDPTRRGNPALWVEKGPVEAMRTADTMIITAIESVFEFPKNIIGTLLGGWKTSWQGESQDYSIVKGLQQVNGPFYDMYMKVIKRKTASLFATAAKMGAQTANATEEDARKIYTYGEDAGIVYQLADDVVDFKRGKFELLPALALAQLDQTLKEQFLGAISQGKMNIGEAVIGTGINIEQFLKSELKARLKKVDTQVGQMDFLNEKYKPLIAQFPGKAVRSMLAELKMESFLE